MGEIKTLADGFSEEQARVRGILGIYKELGEQGAFGAAMIEQSLKNADRAAVSGDTIKMLAAYNDLKEITG